MATAVRHEAAQGLKTTCTAEEYWLDLFLATRCALVDGDAKFVKFGSNHDMTSSQTFHNASISPKLRFPLSVYASVFRLWMPNTTKTT